ncbi:MAG TPA: hypothetical protein VGM39_13355 [Kofleriaceae bacterium]
MPFVQLDLHSTTCVVDEAVERTNDLLGYAAVSPGATRTLRIDIDGASASLTVTNPDGTRLGPRTLSARDCAALQAPLAVVLATMIRSLPDDEPVAPAPAPQTHESIDEPAAPRVARNISLLIGASGAASMNGTAMEFGGGARYVRGTHSVSVEVRDQFSQTDDVHLGELFIGQVRTSRIMADVVPCAHRGWFAGCAIASVGWVDATGVDLMDARSVRSPVVAVGGRVEAEHEFAGGLGLRLRVDGRAAVTQTRLTVEDETVWTSARFSVVLGIDMLAHIP